MKDILVPISPGELLDKITILRIKSARMSDAAKLVNVRAELAELEKTWTDAVGTTAGLADEERALQAVNERLWVIEDDIRDCERAKDFGPKFVELARAVYHQNDRRAELKREINLLLGSQIIEEKSYAKY